tara:strand:+ start:286 stop:387 length:102 start_codon:yes stop_codon:yes gene_type:complete
VEQALVMEQGEEHQALDRIAPQLVEQVVFQLAP